MGLLVIPAVRMSACPAKPRQTMPDATVDFMIVRYFVAALRLDVERWALNVSVQPYGFLSTNQLAPARHGPAEMPALSANEIDARFRRPNP